MANITWTKLKDGNWGLRATAALNEGEGVSVAKKDGSASPATVGRLVWTGNGVWLYATGPKPATTTTTTTAAPARRTRVTRRGWRPCGYPGCCPEYCDECDGEGAGSRW